MTTPPTPPGGPYNSSAPESWRSAARNVAERSKKSARPGPKSDSQHLHLKLDADSYDDYRGVPKSRLPVIVLAFLLLLAVAGGGAYWAQNHGGLAALASRLHLVPQALEPPATPPQDQDQPLGTRNEGVAASPQPSANGAAQALAGPANPASGPSAAPTAAQPSAAVQAASKPPAEPTPAQAAATPQGEPRAPTAADSNAQALADPDAPTEQPARTPPVQRTAARGATVTPQVKPAAHKPSVPRTVVRHDPVIKIRDLAAPQNLDAPPEPSGMPYVPAPSEPPAPDEPR